MANCFEMSDIEEKPYLESSAFSEKQVKKVDEELTIEFTDIKQEPSFHFDHKQNFQPVGNEIKTKCISCDTSFANQGFSNGIATIHETCFQKLCTRLYLATNKVQDLEGANKSMIGKIETLERDKKELYEKLTLVRNEQDTSKDKEKLAKNILDTENGKVIESETEIKVTEEKSISQSKSVKPNSSATKHNVRFIDTIGKFKLKGKRVECLICNKEYYNKDAFNRHFNDIHRLIKKPSANRPLGGSKCEKCYKTFATKQNLKAHTKLFHDELNSRSTSKEFRFKCDKCYKIFGSKLTLKIHNNSVHEGIKFQCDFCQKQYGTLGALKIHTSSVHDGITFQCEVCDKHFATLSAKKVHVREKHTD